ncbi:MAG: anti-sigma factor [Coleofasciculaceae cyanobacterium SM2_3_26]|nr:anti-sigma factor [Coleofasciculaceae cyanobacterium SM2_3_26]
MSQSIPPEELELLIAGYVLNSLTDEEAALFEELLDDAEVVRAIAQMEQTLEKAYAPTEIQPSPRLRAALMSAATAKPATSASSVNAPRARVLVLPVWAKALGGVAAALIVGLSTSNYLLWRSLQASQATAQEPVVILLQPTEALTTPAKVMVKVNPDTLQGTLIVENLPPLEPGKVYVLWTVLAPDAPFTKDPKNAILTQVFAVEAEENQTQPFFFPSAFQNPEVVEAIAVTIEDADAPQSHKSAPILIQKL